MKIIIVINFCPPARASKSPRILQLLLIVTINAKRQALYVIVVKDTMHLLHTYYLDKLICKKVSIVPQIKCIQSFPLKSADLLL